MTVTMRLQTLSIFAVAMLVWAANTNAQPQQQSPPASPAELATRRQLIQQTLQADAAGNHQQALELGLRALQIQVSASLLLLVAEQQDALRLYGDALSNAERCAQLARDPSHVVQDRTFVINGCDRLVNGLQHRVGHVRILLPSTVPNDLRVSIAGSRISSAVYGVPFVVNPGTVRVEATVNGQSILQRDVMVAEGATVDVPITIRIPESTVSTQHQTVPIAMTRPVNLAPVIITGIGIAGFITAGITFGLRESSYGQLRSICEQQANPDSFRCRDSSLSRQALSETITMTTTTNVLIGLSTATTITGVIWLIVDRATATRPSINHTQVLLHNNSIELQGTW